MADVDINRCEFPKQGTMEDTRVFTPGEVVCVYSVKHGVKRGIYEAPAPALGKLRMHLVSGLGSEKPQRIFFGYVGKLREPRNLPQDAENKVFSFMGGQRCSFISNEGPVQSDTRTFEPGEEVCLRDIVLSGNRRPTKGIFKRKMGMFLVVEADGMEVPTPSFNVGKVLKSEEQAEAIADMQGFSADTQRLIEKMLGSKRRTRRAVP